MNSEWVVERDCWLVVAGEAGKWMGEMDLRLETRRRVADGPSDASGKGAASSSPSTKSRRRARAVYRAAALDGVRRSKFCEKKKPQGGGGTEGCFDDG